MGTPSSYFPIRTSRLEWKLRETELYFWKIVLRARLYFASFKFRQADIEHIMI